MNLPTLYTKTKTGSIQQCIISYDNNMVNTQFGLVDGEQQYVSRECTGKNIGKKNETSPSQQAELEAKSKWKQKYDKGYRESIEELEDSINIFFPMLAKSLRKSSGDIDVNIEKSIVYPVYIQRKYDGVRCFYDKELLSRNRKSFYHLEHISDWLRYIYEKYNVILDGELYKHGWSLQEILKRIKHVNEKPADSHLINFICYDLYNMNDTKMKQINRLELLRKIFNNETIPDCIKLAETKVINQKEDIEKYLKQFTQEGYEGIMIRNQQGIYLSTNKRSKDLIKFKLFDDAEYKIIDVLQATEGTMHEGAAIFVCITKNNKTFNVTPKMSLEERRQIFINKNNYINKMLTVRYNEMTDDNIPKFGRGITVRDYE